MIKQDPLNYRKHNKTNQRLIKKSLKECGAGRSVLIDSEGTLIAGNGVYEQAEKLGLKTRIVQTDGSELVVVQRTDLKPEDLKRKKLALADNATTDSSDWDVQKLTQDWQVEELADWGVEIDQGAAESVKETLNAAEKTKVQITGLDERLEKAEYVFWAFSGGRDSTRALISTYKQFADKGKHCEVLYVDNRMEFPDLIQHIRRVCKDLGAKLTQVPTSKDLYTEFFSQDKFPSHFYMPCVEILINKVLDDYIKSVVKDQEYVLIRGGQKKQKTKRSNTDYLQTVKEKPNLLIFNPLFLMTEEQLKAPVPEWAGYAQGFQRTACWACPFQTRKQWEALRVCYPLLFEELKTLFSTIRMQFPKGDGTAKIIQDYWGKEIGLNLHLEEF